MAEMKPITMPKWGLAMEEGMLARWLVEEGAEIAAGQEIMDIETSKIANAFESPVSGVLRRRVAAEGETLPVGALLGVVADPAVPDLEVDAFVVEFLAGFTAVARGAATGPQAETVEAGGRRIRRLRLGPEEGAPFLLVHGFGADLNSWMFNQEKLAEGRPVHAIDLPGHGGSGKEVGDGGLGGLVAAVAAYMDAAGLSGAHLVGHSLGGAVAIALAAARPELVSALTLIAPAGLGEEIAGAFIDGFIAETRAKKLRPVLEMLVADPGAVTGDMVEETIRFKRLDGATEALKAIAAANFPGGRQANDLRGTLAGLAVPVHVVWGEADRILPAAQADGLPERIAVSRLAGAGHIPHMEKAAEINAILTAAR